MIRNSGDVKEDMNDLMFEDCEGLMNVAVVSFPGPLKKGIHAELTAPPAMMVLRLCLYSTLRNIEFTNRISYLASQCLVWVSHFNIIRGLVMARLRSSNLKWESEDQH